MPWVPLIVGTSHLDCNVHNRYITKASRTAELTDSKRVDGFTNQAVTVKVAKYFDFGVNLAVGL